MKTKLSYSEFRTKRINFENTRPNYLKGIEDDFENITRHIYENYYLKGKVPHYAK